MSGHPKFTPRVEPRRKPDGNYSPGDFFFPRAAADFLLYEVCDDQHQAGIKSATWRLNPKDRP